DDRIADRSSLRGGIRPAGAQRQMPVGSLAVEVMHRDAEAALDQACREMAAQMAEADEAVADRRRSLAAVRQGPSPSIEIHRLFGGLEVERLVVIGMRQSHRLVELDAQTRLARRDDEALLEADRLLQDLRVEAAPVLDALEDQEVGGAGA